MCSPPGITTPPVCVGRRLPCNNPLHNAHRCCGCAGAPQQTGYWDGAANKEAEAAHQAAITAPVGSGGAGAGGDKRKWARVQVDKPTAKQQRPEGQNEYNIWYGKYLGERNDRERERASNRCVIWRDAGLTMADVKGDQPYFCIHFARGMI
jgi:hypothetical protein